MTVPTAAIDKFLSDLVSFLDSSEIDDWLLSLLLKYEAERRSPRRGRRHRRRN